MNIPQAELDKLIGQSFTGSETDERESVEDDNEEVKPQENEIINKSKEQVSSSPEEDDVADKARVPYSRFESVRERAIRAEERLKLYEEQQAQSKTVESDVNIDLPNEWVELYGDSDVAKKAYQLQVRLNERIQEEATNKAIERLSNREKEEKEQLNKNIELIDNSLSEFKEKIGKNFTEAEESAILDVQDEFTSKDDDGNYISSLFPLDKAYEIYTLRQQSAKIAKTQAKQRVVSITGASSEGEISNPSANYNPNAWGSWRDKV